MEVSHLGESSLTSRSHRVNPRSLLGPCFAVVVYVETWWPTLNVKLSYKPPRYWRILFWSRICPRQFIYLKMFRALVVPGGGCCKGIILQERQLNHRFYYSSPVISDKKRGYNRSVYTCTQTEEKYVRTDGETVYLWDQRTINTSLVNTPIQRRPQGPALQSCYIVQGEENLWGML